MSPARRSADMPQPPLLAPSATTGPQSSIGWLWLTLGLLALAGLLVLHAFPPQDYGFYPRCGLFLLTGLHCPGCGSLRALSHLSHGRFLAAMDSNALLIIALPVGLVWGAICCRRRPSSPIPKRWTTSRTVLVLLLPVVLFGVLRNLPWYPFVLLAP